jgi:hypothetical protein
MPESSTSASDSLRAGNRVVAYGIAAIVLILLAAAVFLFLSLPDANAFNARVERIFVENDDLRRWPRSSCWKSSPSRAPPFRRCCKAIAW